VAREAAPEASARALLAIAQAGQIGRTKMAEKSDLQRMAAVFVEFHLGTAMMAAFVFHVLEKKGLLAKAEVDQAIREASEMVPEQFAADPRFAPFSSLRVLLDDPEMRHVTPFRWR
jgi:hypothetical protein